jgi:hypothetical protein
VPLTFLRTDAAGESLAFESVADVPLVADATLTPVAWGTRIELDCRYVGDGASETPEEGWPYALVVVDRDGDRSEVSSWRATPGSVARLAAGTAVDLDDIASLEIRTLGGGDLLMRATAE